jgi:cytochrome c biogenesis protein CcdA
MCGVLLLAMYAMGQAVTFAWLSGFPERAFQLESLRSKVWGYGIGAIVLIAIDLILLVCLIKKKNQ